MQLRSPGRVLVVVVGVAITALLAAPAPGAVDTTDPTLTSPVKASFAVGQQIDVGAPLICGDDPQDIRVSAVPVEFAWAGSDDSGSVSYWLEGDTSNGPVGVFANSDQTSYEGAVGSNANQDCGGGSESIYRWALTAADPAGNTKTNAVYGGRIRLTQNNGRSDQAFYATQPTVKYQGGWRRSRCACWSGGTVQQTSTRGASVTIAPQPFTGASGVENHHVGLVMHKGPDRGKFRVFVDGELRSTVDLYAPRAQPRTIVWQAAFVDIGHRIRIVNLATPDRPRIDLDAILTN